MNSPLYLIRHTKVAIKEGICYGQLDVPLAKSFASEARTIYKKIKPLSLSSTYCSPLQRCVLLARTLRLKATSDARLMEMNFGQWEGKSWDAIFDSQEGKHWFKSYWTTPCPKGESFQDLLHRTKAFLQELSGSPRAAPDEPLCLVTHAGVIRAILVLVCKVEPTAVFDITIPHGHIIAINKGCFTVL